MKPNEEDLRAAREIVGTEGRSVYDFTKLERRIASAIAAEREKAAKVAEAGNCEGSDPFAGIASQD